MIPIEPGETFTIAYGRDKRLTVPVLSIAQERKIAAILVTSAKAEENNDAAAYDYAYDLLRTIVGDEKADQLADNVNARLIMEIVSQTMQCNAIGDDTKKKLESPLSLKRGSYAKDAAANADWTIKTGEPS